MRHYVSLLTLSVVLFGCGPPSSLGSVRTSIENINGVDTYILEVNDMSVADTIDAINQFLPKDVEIDPRVDSERTVNKLSIRGTDWLDVVEQLDERWADLEIVESDAGLTLIPHGG